MERLTEWVGSGPERKAIARQDRRDIGDKDCVTRLAAYEDTGLTPDAAAQLKQIAEIFNCDPGDEAQLKQLCNKLRDWQQAERAGRLVVLPCKVGDRLYVIGHALKCIDTETVEGIIFRADGVEIEGFWEDSNYRPEQFGKTVFLTRKEAEAAARKEENT